MAVVILDGRPLDDRDHQRSVSIPVLILVRLQAGVAVVILDGRPLDDPVILPAVSTPGPAAAPQGHRGVDGRPLDDPGHLQVESIPVVTWSGCGVAWPW